MPIRIDDELPAKHSLEQENVFVMSKKRADKQDIRPLKIVILNLMPTKIETETQLLRLLSNSPLQVNIDLLQVESHKSKNTSEEHMLKFYKTFKEIKHKKYDGMIITGAPLAHLKFEEVDFWQEFLDILEWTKTNVYSVLNICWAAFAALYYKFGILPVDLPEKQFGVFPHRSLDTAHPLMRGLDDVFYVPHSREWAIDKEDIAKIKDLQIISYSDMSGIHIISDMDCRNFYITGHGEYDRDTLKNEYIRDLNKGLPIQKPYNYFPDDDPEREPKMNWKSAANLIYSNWLNYFVYQQTPYDLNNL